MKPEFHDLLERSIAEDDVPGLVTMSSFALVTDRIKVSDPEVLDRISEFHIWTDDYAGKRLHWRPKQPLTVAFVRVYPLLQPQALPVLDEYGGCKSWIDLGQEVPMGELAPAIADADYERLSTSIKERLT